MMAGVEVVYPKGSDADMFIMAEAKLLRLDGAPRVVIVSDDREISAALDYTNAMGWMHAEMYLQEMERVRCTLPLEQRGCYRTRSLSSIRRPKHYYALGSLHVKYPLQTFTKTTATEILLFQNACKCTHV